MATVALLVGPRSWTSRGEGGAVYCSTADGDRVAQHRPRSQRVALAAAQGAAPPRDRGARAWQEHGNNMARAWQQHKGMATTWHCQGHGNNMARGTTWQEHNKITARTMSYILQTILCQASEEKPRTP